MKLFYNIAIFIVCFLTSVLLSFIVYLFVLGYVVLFDVTINWWKYFYISLASDILFAIYIFLEVKDIK